MEENRQIDWKRLLRMPFCQAAVWAFLAGLIAHFFGFVNPLHNYDDIATQPYGYGTGISSGRWFLTILGRALERIGCTYNLPFMNGLIFLLLIVLAAGFFVSALEIQKKSSAALLGALFAVFPAATSALYFKFTAPYYGFAILLAVLAAWILPRCRYGIVLSAIFTALSLGIYQAYTPITIGMLVLMLLRYALSGNADFRTLVKRSIRSCVALILGVVVYFICLKITLYCTGTQLSNYQGVNTMGQIALSDLPRLLKAAFMGIFQLSSQNYCGLANDGFIRLVYRLLGICSVLPVAYILLMKIRRIDITIVAAALCLVFPIAVNFIVIMCPSSGLYSLMIYGFVLVPCFPIVAAECLPAETGWRRSVKFLFQKAVALLLAFLVFFYAYEANVSYLSLYFSNRQTENYFNSMIAQIRSTDGFTSEKEWAFLGGIQDPLFHSVWDEETRYGGNLSAPQMVNSYSWIRWIQHYMGYDVPLASNEELLELCQTEEFIAMPCWPDQGSIKVIGDNVVIKFSNVEPW